jgi:hypothetical protein
MHVSKMHYICAVNIEYMCASEQTEINKCKIFIISFFTVNFHH